MSVLKRGAVAAVVASAALALPAAAPAGVLTKTSGGVKAVLHAPNHTPAVGKKWWITIDVTHGKAKPSGSVKYQFEFGGAVVSTQPGHSFTGGHFRDWLIFPAKASGIKLTLDTVVKTKYATVDLPWTVTAG